MFSLGISGSYVAARPFSQRLADRGWPILDLDQGADPTGISTLLFLPRDLMESERLLFEEQGWAKRLPALETIIIGSTLSPRYVRALRGRISKAITLVDAPVVGAHRLAEGGTCSLLLGGPTETLDRLAPLFAVLGQHATRMGDYGTAMAAKALQDCLAAASSAITRSALDWAEAQGIEENRMLPFLRATFGPELAPPPVEPGALAAAAQPGEKPDTELARRVESALGSALRDVHLTPPKAAQAATATRARHLH